MSWVGCRAARMSGAALFAPPNLCSACAVPGSRRPVSPASATIGDAAVGAYRTICRSTTCSSRYGAEPRLGSGRSLGVRRRNPGDAAEADALFGQLARFFGARFAIDAVRIDFAIVDAARLLGKA